MITNVGLVNLRKRFVKANRFCACPVCWDRSFGVSISYTTLRKRPAETTATAGGREIVVLKAGAWKT